MGGVREHNLERAQEVDDDILVRNAQRDPSAFAAIFDRYWDPVFRYCYYRLGDWHLAEDAAAQIFLNVVSALPGYVHPGHDNAFRGWLFTIAFRVVSNVRRTEARHPQAPLESAGERAAPDLPLDEHAIAYERQRMLYHVIRQLEPNQRELVELRLAGLSDVEIARVLDKSPAAIRKAQSRAVAVMRGLLANAGQETGGDPHD